jgi:hypothetical protein
MVSSTDTAASMAPTKGTSSSEAMIRLQEWMKKWKYEFDSGSPLTDRVGAGAYLAMRRHPPSRVSSKHRCSWCSLRSSRRHCAQTLHLYSRQERAFAVVCLPGDQSQLK